MVGIYVFLSILIISLVSLIGIATISINKKLLEKYTLLLVALSVGALMGDVFLHLIPSIYTTPEKVEKSIHVGHEHHNHEHCEHHHEKTHTESGHHGHSHNKEFMNLGFYILSGFLLFMILEKFLHWKHQHPVDTLECSHNHIEPFGIMNIVGDALHNFIDGALIAASFQISPTIGLSTTVAIFFHEVPQEIGDYGVLRQAGFSNKKALMWNFTSALFAFAGAALAFMIPFSSPKILIAFTIGGFIYIAGSDLVPELHKTTCPKKSFLQFLFIIIGIALMYGITFLE